MPPEAGLGILLISGGHERAHYAFMMAAGALAVGRRVTLFATNQGCRALAWDMAAWAGEEAATRRRGVATLAELREAGLELGIRLLACDAGLLLADLSADALLGGVEVVGVPTFLSAIGPAAIVTL